MNTAPSKHYVSQSQYRKLVNSKTLLLLTTALALPLASQANDLLNDNFESPKWTEGTTLSTTPQNGWTGNGSVDGTRGIVEISNGANHTPGGSQSLYLRDNATWYTPSAVYALGETVTTGNLNFWLKQDSNYADISYSVGFQVNGTTNFDFTIGTIGDHYGLHIRDAGGTRVQTVLASSVGYVASDWNNINISFDKAAASLVVSLNNVAVITLTSQIIGDRAINLEAAQLAFSAGWLGSTDTAVFYDDITFSPTIPEASTWALWGALGALALVIWKRSRSA